MFKIQLYFMLFISSLTPSQKSIGQTIEIHGKDHSKIEKHKEQSKEEHEELMNRIANRKPKTHKAIKDNLTVGGFEIGYNQYTDEVNSPCQNAISAGAFCYANLMKNKLFLNFELGATVGLTTNNTWIANAFSTPIENFNKTGSGGSTMDLVAYLMPVLIDSRHFALLVGAGIGADLASFPSMDINNASSNSYVYNKNATANFMYGLKSEIYFGQTFFIKIAYLSTLGSPDVTTQLNGNDINTVPYSYSHYTAGVGFRCF